jgi:hypothetical protein
MRKQKVEEKPLRFNVDGELENVLYCTYCWMLNELDAQTCVSCGEYIADQGPELRARLSRIRRHASSGLSVTGGETEGIGSISRRKDRKSSDPNADKTADWYATRQKPDLLTQLYRISRYANDKQVQKDEGRGVVSKILLALLVVYLLYVIWIIAATVLHL